MTTKALPLAIALGALFTSALPAEQRLILPEAAVGRGLQQDVTFKLAEPAPESGMELTLTSNDPSKLIFSDAPDKAGSPTLKVKIGPKRSESRDVLMQALGDSGQASYTVTAPGMSAIKGSVTLAHSAIVVLGPGKTPRFTSTPNGNTRLIQFASVMLDASGKIAEEQGVAGGSDLEIEVLSSRPEAGKLTTPTVTIAGGGSFTRGVFKPSGLGDTTLSPAQPKGFTVPAEKGSVVASMQLPGMAGLTEIYLGKDLQLPAILCLGEPAPKGGLQVTMKSSDPSKLLLSSDFEKVGTATLTLTVAEGQQTVQYYPQALSDSGEVTYTISAPAFRPEECRLGLAPSGVIVAYEGFGPPDEAAVKRKGGQNVIRRFYPSVSDAKAHPKHMIIWTAYLHPDTGMAADITVQPLRAGMTLEVFLKSSNPEVATVEPKVVIAGGHDSGIGAFTPLAKGETTISIETPKGMTQSKNATSTPATVSQ